jgi:SAM-dependent methyltransferase
MDRAEDEMALDRRKRTTPAAVFGNYSNYYVKRADDLRYQLISPHLSGDILDIGCNSGRDTIKIAQSNGVRFITGIDIDQKLISDCERARESRRPSRPTLL